MQEKQKVKQDVFTILKKTSIKEEYKVEDRVIKLASSQL
jgi:hypothetical protein